MKTLLFLTAIVLMTLVNVYPQQTNKAVAKPTPFTFLLMENNNGECVVVYNKKTLTVKIKNAPKTLYSEHRNFAREDAYVQTQKYKLIQRNAKLEAAEVAFGQGHTGTADAINYELAMRAKIGAERAKYNAQVSILEQQERQLENNKEKDKNNEPFHHPKYCQGIYIGKDGDIPRWEMVGVY